MSARSRSIAIASAACGALACLWMASNARASDVAVLPIGTGERGAAVTTALREATTGAGHRPVEAARISESLTARGGREPTVLRELTAMGAELQADYLVGGTARARGRTGYTLSLRIVTIMSGRLEEAEFDVNDATQARRLESILRIVCSEAGIESAPVGFLEDPDAVVAGTPSTPPGGQTTTPPPTGDGSGDDELTESEREALRRAEEEERRRREEEERA
ncbi:MAG: hypothetical protein IT379_14265, partial [Deltaproteobacteria bacterium]|nr:hypothetical protein [Deltaproteobacteria bacterium]